MHFQYTVTQDDYLRLLESVLKKRETAPVRILLFLLLTVGQSAWVVYMLLTADLPRNGKIFMVLWSLLLSSINVVFRCTRKARARSALNSLVKTGQISPDFWEQHQLSAESGLLRLKYGNVELECPCAEVEVTAGNGVTSLTSHGIVFDLVPDGCGLAEQIGRSVRDERSAQLEETVGDPDSADHVFRFSVTGREFRKLQSRIYQSYFVNRTLKSTGYIIKLLASALLCWYLVRSPFSVRSVLCAALILYLNFPAILCIPPVTDRYLASRLAECRWLSDSTTYAAVFLVKGSSAVLSLNGMNWQYSLTEPEFIFSEKYGIALSSGKWPAAFIPADQFVNRFRQDEFARTLRFGLRQQ